MDKISKNAAPTIKDYGALARELRNIVIKNVVFFGIKREVDQCNQIN